MTTNIIFKPFMGLALIGFLLVGCQEDFLDVVPTDRVSDASILSDSTLFEAYVINRYLGVRLTDKEGDGNLPGFGRGFEYAMWSSLTDESIYNNDDNTWFIQQGQLSPQNTGIAGTIWGRSYRSIRECNYALANIGELEMSQSGKDLLIAELKFIRAFRYFDLIKNYGDVVFMGDNVAQLGDDFTDPSYYERIPKEEAIEYTIQQLDDAAAVFGAHVQPCAIRYKRRCTCAEVAAIALCSQSTLQRWRQ